MNNDDMSYVDKKRQIIKWVDGNQTLRSWFTYWLSASKCVCHYCGKAKQEKSFYHVKDNHVYKNGRLPICKNCIDRLYREYFYKYGSGIDALNKLCSLFDIYYDTRLAKSIIGKTKPFGRYLTKLNLRQNKYKYKKGYDRSDYFD